MVVDDPAFTSTRWHIAEASVEFGGQGAVDAASVALVASSPRSRKSFHTSSAEAVRISPSERIAACVAMAASGGEETKKPGQVVILVSGSSPDAARAKLQGSSKLSVIKLRDREYMPKDQ